MLCPLNFKILFNKRKLSWRVVWIELWHSMPPCSLHLLRYHTVYLNWRLFRHQHPWAHESLICHWTARGRFWYRDAGYHTPHLEDLCSLRPSRTEYGRNSHISTEASISTPLCFGSGWVRIYTQLVYMLVLCVRTLYMRCYKCKLIGILPVSATCVTKLGVSIYLGVNTKSAATR